MARNPTSPNVIGIIISVVIVLVIVGAGIYPQHRGMNKENLKINELRAGIERQKLLHPLYLNLVEKARFEPPPELTYPKRSKLARSDLGRLSSLFADAAESSNLMFETVMPQVNSMTDRSSHLRADLTLRGHFLDFRDFLMKLGEMPFLEHIERVRIERTGTLDLFEVRLWLTLE